MRPVVGLTATGLGTCLARCNAARMHATMAFASLLPVAPNGPAPAGCSIHSQTAAATQLKGLFRVGHWRIGGRVTCDVNQFSGIHPKTKPGVPEDPASVTLVSAPLGA